MKNDLSAMVNLGIIDELYVLIRWPELEEFIGEEWFQEECFPCKPFDEGQCRWSGYFVPIARYMAVYQPG